MQTTQHDTINGWATIRNRFGFGTTKRHPPPSESRPSRSIHLRIANHLHPLHHSTQLQTPSSIRHSTHKKALEATRPLSPSRCPDPLLTSRNHLFARLKKKLDNHMQTSAAHGPPARSVFFFDCNLRRGPWLQPNLLSKQSCSICSDGQTLSPHTARLCHFVRFLGTTINAALCIASVPIPKLLSLTI